MSYDKPQIDGVFSEMSQNTEDYALSPVMDDPVSSYWETRLATWGRDSLCTPTAGLPSSVFALDITYPNTGHVTTLTFASQDERGRLMLVLAPQPVVMRVRDF